MLGIYYKMWHMQYLHKPLIINHNREYDDRAALRRLTSTVLRKTQVIAKDNGHCLLEIVYSKTHQIFITHEISNNWNSPRHGRRHY
jgi:hypothetical protein